MEGKDFYIYDVRQITEEDIERCEVCPFVFTDHFGALICNQDSLSACRCPDIILRRKGWKE